MRLRPASPPSTSREQRGEPSREERTTYRLLLGSGGACAHQALPEALPGRRSQPSLRCPPGPLDKLGVHGRGFGKPVSPPWRKRPFRVWSRKSACSAARSAGVAADSPAGLRAE